MPEQSNGATLASVDFKMAPVYNSNYSGYLEEKQRDLEINTKKLGSTKGLILPKYIN